MTIMYKLIQKGVWGLGSKEKLDPHSVVIVTKKDGTKKSETVGIQCGEKDGLFLYTIIAKDRPVSSRRTSGGYGRRCPNCGSHEVMCDANGKPYFCDECDSI